MVTKSHPLDVASRRLKMAQTHMARAIPGLLKHGMSSSAAQLNTIMLALNEISLKAEAVDGSQPE